LIFITPIEVSCKLQKIGDAHILGGIVANLFYYLFGTFELKSEEQ